MSLTILDLIFIAITVDFWRCTVDYLQHSYSFNSKNRNKFMPAPSKGQKIPTTVPPPIKRK